MRLPIENEAFSVDDLSLIAGLNGPKIEPPLSTPTGDKERLLPVNTTYTALFNWNSLRYEEISSSVKNTLGYDSFIFLRKGIKFFLSLIHPDDLISFRKMHIKIFECFYQTPPEWRSKLKFSYNFRAKAADGSYRHILRQSTFTNLTPDGKPYLEYIESVDITSYSRFSNIKLTVSKLHDDGCPTELHEFDFKQRNYCISKRELEILDLAGKGFTTKDISSMLFLSVETVKTHRKNIMVKTGACNIAEAVRLVYGE